MKRECRNSTISLNKSVMKKLRVEKEKEEKSLGVKLTWEGFLSRFLRRQNGKNGA